MSRTANQAPRWQPTWALRRAVFLIVALLGTALVFGNAALALLVLPLAVGGALAWSDRPAGTAMRLDVEVPRITDQRGDAAVRIELDGPSGLQIATVRAPFGVKHGAGRLVCVAADDGGRSLSFPVDTSRWGKADFDAIGVVASGPDGLLVTAPIQLIVGACRVLPTAQDLPAAELPARSAGQVGAHRTRRPGEGSELMDVRKFRTGDRLRRIDWRVSARRSEVYVRHTAIDADAELVICVDPRHDVGSDVAAWTEVAGSSPATSLDETVHIASALATTYLRLGDRVGLVNLAVPEWGVPLGTGRGQLTRIRWQLAGLAATPGLPSLTVRDGALPPGAVAIVLSPLLDEAATNIVAALSRSHRDVVVLDVLPEPLELPRDRALRAASRVILAERDHRMAMLRRHGVIITRWQPERVGMLLRRRQRARRMS